MYDDVRRRSLSLQRQDPLEDQRMDDRFEGRPPFSSRNPQEVSDAEYREAFQTYTAYFGTYTVDAANGTVEIRPVMDLSAVM